jgi:glycosyltransferase involved in cell wall biosynthesis
MLDRGLDRGLATATRAPVSIDVVICTYNHAASLDAVLSTLSRQSPAVDVAWSVLVIDNASTDSTADVVDSHRSRRLLPGLRRVREDEQGLTPARRRGVRETRAPWIAFVDDDNLLEPGWLDAIAQVIRLHPTAGAIGGRVVLDWERPPPAFFTRFGFCFAEQEAGEVVCEMSNLVGAGMVVNRAALIDCGWLERPLLADRVGERLVSGGDVEIAQRIRGAGYALWFTPEAVLRHRIPPSRVNLRYLLRANYGLGGSEALVSALTWPGDWPSWRRAAQWRTVKAVAGVFRKSRGLPDALASLSFAFGFARGVNACVTLAAQERKALLGAAARNRTDDLKITETK